MEMGRRDGEVDKYDTDFELDSHSLRGFLLLDRLEVELNPQSRHRKKVEFCPEYGCIIQYWKENKLLMNLPEEILRSVSPSQVHET